MYNQGFIRTFIIFICIFSFLILHSIAADVDHDNIDDDYEQILAERYVPHYIFHPDERFYFMDPSDFMNKSNTELNNMITACTGNSGAFFNDVYWSVVCDDDIRIYPQDLGFPNHTYFTEMLGLLNVRNLSRIASLNNDLYNCIVENGWKLKIPTMPFGSVGSKDKFRLCYTASQLNPM